MRRQSQIASIRVSICDHPDADPISLASARALVFVGELALLGRFEFLEQDLSRELEFAALAFGEVVARSGGRIVWEGHEEAIPDRLHQGLDL
jgi:hypothetical protein